MDRPGRHLRLGHRRKRETRLRDAPRPFASRKSLPARTRQHACKDKQAVLERKSTFGDLLSAMRRLEHRIRTWWRGRCLYLEGPTAEAPSLDRPYLSDRLDDGCRLIAETALSYMAKVLTGRSDIRSG
jgi:hypothetical protein